jgi:glutamate-5-semialdehyde dehydrogenase
MKAWKIKEVVEIHRNIFCFRRQNQLDLFLMSSTESEVLLKARRAKNASYETAILPASIRETLLLKIAQKLDASRAQIKENNQKDLEAGKAKGLSEAMLDRLLLNDKRITEMIEGLNTVAALPDKLGSIENMTKLPNGLLLGQMNVPLGVVAIIYESRPNVTIDAAGLCIKSGNSIILRGGSEALHSNIYLTNLMREVAQDVGYPVEAIQIVTNPDHTLVDEMVTLRKDIDVLIPRGSAKFIEHIVGIAKIPVIETGAGNCHTYIDKYADIEMGVEIVYNGKTQRPSVCNATKKVLIHKDIAAEFLPKMKARLDPAKVIYLTDEVTHSYFPNAKIATEEEWAEEFLDMRLGVKIVGSLTEAISHINHYSSHHTEAIVTKDYTRAMRFLNAIDSGSLFWNASTRFTDGGQFGMGAEIGISTQKLHWRGPMSVGQLMSKKFVTLGTGQVRP